MTIKEANKIINSVKKGAQYLEPKDFEIFHNAIVECAEKLKPLYDGWYEPLDDNPFEKNPFGEDEE